jgi:ABC-type multidrug transport system ATPase subunit
MQISLTNVGKQYDYKWILRGLNYEIPSGSRVAISGHNGSGKSTLIKILSGFLSQTSGEVIYTLENRNILREHVFRHTAIAAPYIDLIQEFTVLELARFHCQMKKMTDPMELIRFCYLENSANKPVQYLSSGMLQRLKLALCLMSPGNLFLLDEPTSNLDSRGIDWYQSALQNMPKEATVIVASNMQHDFPENAMHLSMPIR